MEACCPSFWLLMLLVCCLLLCSVCPMSWWIRLLIDWSSLWFLRWICLGLMCLSCALWLMISLLPLFCVYFFFWFLDMLLIWHLSWILILTWWDFCEWPACVTCVWMMLDDWARWCHPPTLGEYCAYWSSCAADCCMNDSTFCSLFLICDWFFLSWLFWLTWCVVCLLLMLDSELAHWWWFFFFLWLLHCASLWWFLLVDWLMTDENLIWLLILLFLWWLWWPSSVCFSLWWSLCLKLMFCWWIWCSSLWPLWCVTPWLLTDVFPLELILCWLLSDDVVNFLCGDVIWFYVLLYSFIDWRFWCFFMADLLLLNLSDDLSWCLLNCEWCDLCSSWWVLSVLMGTCLHVCCNTAVDVNW